MIDYSNTFRNEADIAETKRLFAAGLLSFSAMVTILEQQYSRPSLVGGLIKFSKNFLA